MELQFNKTALPCLRRAVRELQNQEVTQEVKLSDAMPDIGKVIGAWGQILIRSKEWRSGSMNVSGGVIVFVMYAPEDGGEPRNMEAWLPFQMNWDLPDTERDGTILVSGLLRGVDARSTSARKLMVRGNVSILGEAMEPVQADIYTPGEMPEDVQLLKRSYPLKYPKEAGEKAFALEETLTMPASCPAVEKIVRYSLQPELIDQKVMAGKVVFRGAAIIHILYRAGDGELKCWDFEIPFSQYTDLEQEYEQDADARVVMAVTSLELEQDAEDTLQLKAGLLGQYVIYDRPVVEIVEDAYSPDREVLPQVQSVDIPIILDDRLETVHAEATAEVRDAAYVIDTAFYPEQPRLRQNGDTAEAELLGTFQMLCAGADGSLRCENARWEGKWSLPSDTDSRVDAAVCPTGKAQGSLMGENASMRADAILEMEATAQKGLSMVTALQIGEKREADPGRPSLILRRAGDERLWDMAKRCGSTVAAIQTVNHLSDEPEDGQYLLIPVS